MKTFHCSFLNRRCTVPAGVFFIGILVGILGGCGGGDNTDARPATMVTTPPAAVVPISVGTTAPPQPTGDTATDGLNWFNYRRQLLGETVLTRTATIDAAAQGHSQYQQLNDTISHGQVTGNPGFTGATLGDRLAAARYRFTKNSYAYGEVISSTIDQSGFNAAEDLIAAIYHRFAIFEPTYRLAGVGSAVSNSGRTYFTTDFTADGLIPALGKGNFLTYPVDQQQGVPTLFASDTESPDPVPERNLVGYPISVHADITSTVTVRSFTVQPRNGNLLTVKLLQNASDFSTPTSAAAIVPLNVLAAATTYDVQFMGTIDGVAVSRTWAFTTR